MTALAQKLKEAGADTVGARLTTACVEAIRLHPNDQAQAWTRVGSLFGHEFLRGIAADMSIPASPAPSQISQQYKPRVVSPERTQRRSEIAQAIKSKYLNSSGVSWSDVGWHELSAMQRDGVEAKALFDAGPAGVPNDGRTVAAVLGIKKIDEIIEEARAPWPREISA